MFPHERSLVKRLKDKPFALLGINSDSDRAALKKMNRAERITWRSWWDNGSVHGPIQTKWQVEKRPAIYVLDAQGVIRHKGTDGTGLDDAVNKLLAELAAEPAQ